MIFDLVKDFADVLDAMPQEHPRHRILKLLDEAVRRDVHFIDRHPSTFFQCLWNTCWWYDWPIPTPGAGFRGFWREGVFAIQLVSRAEESRRQRNRVRAHDALGLSSALEHLGSTDLW